MPQRRWGWLASAGEPVEVLSVAELWGREMAEVLVPSSHLRRRVPVRDVTELAARHWSEAEIAWRAAATRALALSADGELLVAARRGVSLFPHQAATVQRALAASPVRLAICDEVGLGKTITAGAIFAELKARGRARRVVVVAPKGVQLQWVAEMADRFGEEFVRVGPEGVPVDSGVDPWRAFDRVVCPLDAVKPMRRRAGWSLEQVEERNAARFGALVGAGWDMVIIDEAHHVAGSSDEVARYVLAVELAAAAPHILLLSATPHSGKSDGFRRFLGLLDHGFLHDRPVERATVAPHVVRTEKRGAVDSAGRALFRPRKTSLRVIPYGERTVERDLYEAVTEYVRSGWDAAGRAGRNSVGFLVLLMQRLVASSTAAILAALERRSAALGERGAQLALFADQGEDWAELTGEEQYQALAAARGPAWETERAELGTVLRLARDAAAGGADAKVRAFFDLLGELRRSEQDSDVKVLIFTEFVATQDMLLDLLAEAGVSAVAINGSMSLGERVLAQEAFRRRAQVLVSTDAGGEGINLQFAHVVVNWDLPWSPTRLEQRIGRVDRIGQKRVVRAFNLVCEGLGGSEGARRAEREARRDPRRARRRQAGRRAGVRRPPSRRAVDSRDHRPRRLRPPRRRVRRGDPDRGQRGRTVRGSARRTVGGPDVGLRTPRRVRRSRCYGAGDLRATGSRPARRARRPPRDGTGRTLSGGSRRRRCAWLDVDLGSHPRRRIAQRSRCVPTRRRPGATRPRHHHMGALLPSDTDHGPPHTGHRNVGTAREPGRGPRLPGRSPAR